MTVFSDVGGAFLFDASTTPHTFESDPTPGNLAFAGSLGFNFAGQEGFVFTDANPGVAPDTLDISIQWVGVNGTGGLEIILPAGTNIDGDPITAINFELGGPNVLADTLESIIPGEELGSVLSNNFILFDNTGAALFNSDIDPAAFTIDGGGLQAVVGIAAGGADLGGFAIAGGQLDLTIQLVPAPSGAAIAMIGVLGLSRRRR